MRIREKWLMVPSRPCTLLRFLSTIRVIISAKCCVHPPGWLSISSIEADRSSIEAVLKSVVSLRLPSSSEALRLATREAFLDTAGEAFLELAADDCRDFAFFDTVLPLSSACLRRSCMMAISRESVYKCVAIYRRTR